MENLDSKNWNEDRYSELNAYFRERIRKQLDEHPDLQQPETDRRNLQLAEIIDSLPLHDQLLWQEFLELDQLKMHLDMQNYLEGKGSPTDFQNRFIQRYRNPDDTASHW
ncbi:hypothetical protein [Rufibacter ruber]|uniref:hypothetical protein n=1 Tax=Rufibacter ruber TaxID=1783499 RepID=UPI00083308AE|nr:hypothetical protein [Rufibacter ruber]